MDLNVEQYGSENRPTIVFLHGLGVSGWMWHDQVTQLEQDYHCVVVDLPGNGESYLWPWDSFADTAAQVADLIRREAHGGQAHVVGLSLGGYVTLHLLTAHTEVVLSALVSGVTPQPMMGKLLGKILTAVVVGVTKFSFVARLSARAMQLPEDAIPLYERDFGRLSSETVKRVYAEVLDFSMPEMAAETAACLLVSAGDKEAKPILKGLDYFVENYGETAVVKAADAHHGWNGEHPERFTGMVRAWIGGEAWPEGLDLVRVPEGRLLFSGV